MLKAEPASGAWPEGSIWRSVLQCMSDAVIVTDAALVVTGWNDAAREIYGYAEAEAKGRHVAEIIRPRWESAVAREASFEAMRLHGRWRGEVVHTRRDGQLVRILAAVTRLRDASGAMSGMVAVNRDVTAERVAQAAVEQAHDHLAVVRRADALASLAGSVSHNFNNLLAVVGGNAELAQSNLADPERARAHLGVILQAVQQGGELTRQLVSFGRTDQLEARDEDLSTLVRSFAEVLHRVVGDRLRLRLQLSDTPVPARVSGGEVEHALMNLCANARDAGPRSGEVWVRVRTEGDDAVVEVEDDGAGMSPEVRARATEAFFTTRPNGQGTGLGLAVVTRVADRYGGALSITSEPGVGTRVQLRFARRPPAPPAPRPAPSPTPAARYRILLAEDERSLRDVMTALLRMRGHEVVAAADGAEAVELGHSSRFDLLLTDVSMPRMSGPEAAARLRSTDPTLPIVYLSGFPASEFEGESWPHGTFLRKPARMEELCAAIAAAVAERPRVA